MTRPRGRRSNASIVANPVLVGAVTTLVIVVAVFLAYNANNGLPFVPTRQLDVLVSNGANLVKGNEVRSGGFRVGVVTDMQPVMLPNHKVGARLTLKLDKKAGAVPVDSKIVIRPRSALGLKYVELDTGRSKKVFADGATMPATQASVPVELDELYNMFDEPTRRASQGNLQGFGDALAGRGADLNQTIQVASPLFGHLGSVMANLSAPRTELPSFFKELGDAARIVAPVSKTNAHLFTTMANTFDAISRDPQALKSTISESPPTLRAGTESLRVQRPFLEHTAALSRDLDTATTELRGALPTVNSALRVGTPVQRRSVALNDNLQGALGALESLVKAPTTVGSLRGLTATVGTLQPAAALPGPVRDGLQLLEHLLDLRGRAPVGSRRHRVLAARAAEHGHADAGDRWHRLVGRQRVRPRPGRAARPRRPVRAQQRLRAGHRREGQRRLRRRPDRLHPGLQPAARQERQGRPLPGRRHGALPGHRAPGADLRAVRQGGQGPRPEPRPRAGRGDVHRPPGRPRHRHREAAAMRRKRSKGLPPFAAGLLTLAVLAVVTYFGFTKAIPFKHHYTVQAVFPSANGVRSGSPVRVAGVNVGKVTAISHVEDGKQAALVTMRIDKKGLPLHKDATMKIRPRIFLEGNFFVDVSPGSPSAPALHDGDRLPINQTSAPVQLDQVLSALQAPTRKDLQALLRELSSGLKGKGGRGYNASIPYWKPAYRDSAIVADAAQGTQPGDLGRYIDRAGVTAEAIDRNREQLKSLVTDFDTTAGAFAAREQELSAAVGELPRTLNAAMPALGALNRSFPAVRGLIRAARPAVRSSGPAIDASMPFVKQARGLVSKPELRGLSHDLRPLVPALTALNQRSVPLYSQLSQASSCQNDVILPWTKDKIDDKTFPARGPVYEEATKPLPGLAGESRSGDANGQWFRVMLTTPKFAYPMGTDKFFLTGQPLQGVNPPTPKNHARPPLRADVPCETQQAPDLRTVPDAAPQGFDLAQPSAAARADALQKTVDWLRKDLKAEGSSLKVSDVPATVKELTK